MKRNRLISTIVAVLLAMQVSGVTAAPLPADAGIVGAMTDNAKPSISGAEMTVPVKIPLYSPLFDQVTLATVNEEKITLEQFTRFLESVHEGMGEEKKAKRQKMGDILNRMINLRLIIQEGKRMELEKLPEVKELTDTYANQQLREMLLKQAVDSVVPDPKLVEERYHAKAGEYKVTSILFNKEAEAKKAEAELKKGADFAVLQAKALEAKAGEGKPEGEFLKAGELHPQMAKMIAGLKVGEKSSIVPLTAGYLLFRLDEVRYPDNPQAKELAVKELTSEARLKALHDYRDAMIKKHVKLKKELIRKLDFEAAKPGFAAMLKDTRPIAEIKGEKAVTVADLAQTINAKFYHGVELAVKEGKVNKNKDELLTDILSKRVFDKEARIKGIDKSEAYLKKISEHVDSMVFGTFVEKVIRPEVKISEDEVKSAYARRLAEFTYPEMLKIRPMVFKSVAEAEAAIDKLRKGMDFKWFADNATGKIDPATPGVIRFEEGAVTTSSLSDGLQKALAGVRSEEYRLYTDEKGYSYVLFIPQVIPSQAQDMREVEGELRKTIFIEKMNTLVDEWSKKLKEASETRIYADFAQ